MLYNVRMMCYNASKEVYMMTTVNLNVRIDEEVKKKSETICQELGMTLSTAVNVFLRQMVRTGGIPFDVRLSPNAETLSALEDARQHRSLNGPYRSTEALMEALNDDA